MAHTTGVPEPDGGKWQPKLVAGNLALDFANTVSDRYSNVPLDRLAGYDDLLRWARKAEAVEPEAAAVLRAEAAARPVDAESALAAARDLRESLYALFTAVVMDAPLPEAALQRFNMHLGRALAHARLAAPPPAIRWTWETDLSALDAMLWPVARAAADLLTSGEIGRVRECAEDDCRWLFLDTSRNHSRRWCDMENCGNRAKARRYYQRSRGTGA